MSQHALLSPSAAHRWIACPPSARLCENVVDSGSSYADQGTDAHSLCEHKLRKFLGEKTTDPRANLSYFDREMEDATDDYRGFCIEEFERLKEHGEPLMIVEQRVRYEEYVPHGSGSADCVIIGNGEMVVCDYKHGAGIAVSAENNPQLKLYALGCLLAFDGIYDIDTVKMCIIQPRRENVSTVTVFKESLYQWAEEIVKPAAELAFAGEGDYCAGEHCRFCKIKAQCRERATANLALVAYDFTDPVLLENDEIAALLGKIDNLVSWAGDVKEFALTEALKGVKFDGFKVVEGKSNRKYTDEDAVAKRLLGAGYRDIYKPAEILGLTDMTKAVGKARFAELLEGAILGKDGKPTYEPLVIKPQGKPALVPADDKRPAITINSAADDFADQENL